MLMANLIKNSTTTPLIVHGPWIGPSGEPSAPKRILSEIKCEKVIVTRIAAGGDQSFAIVSDPKKSPLDFRDFETKIEILTNELIKDITAKGPEDLLDQDYLEKLEVIFQHPACFNASLLTDTHKPCTSKNNGVDLKAWKHTTLALSKLVSLAINFL